MKRSFLNKLKREDKIRLVETSTDICESYTKKSIDCLQSAKLLLKNNLYETSISMSYYAMYNLLLALLFRVGIKSENHSGSILILKLVLKEDWLYTIIYEAKKERIDKQYYVTTEEDNITKEITEKLLYDAEDFVLKTQLLIKKLNNNSIDVIRERFKDV